MHIHSLDQTRSDDENVERCVEFQTEPARYRHWRLSVDGELARLTMKVDPLSAFHDGCELKLNSYDIGVDIELYDAVQRLRFEHPGVKVVILDSAQANMFCAGANIQMLARASHGHKVNFCKFTNETRNAIEEAAQFSAQRYLAAVEGTAAGGGYELALATDHILLIDDGKSTVSLPEVPLLAVLPGTGGLTRLVDKRKVRRDLADVFCTLEEGIKAQRAVDWGLVDEIAPSSLFSERLDQRARKMAATSDRPAHDEGMVFSPLQRLVDGDKLLYPFLTVEIDRSKRSVTLTVAGPEVTPPHSVTEMKKQGDRFWPVALIRALDDVILHLRFNEPALGVWIFKSAGDVQTVQTFDQFLADNSDHWLVREILLYIKRTLKRLDVTSRTLLTLVEPGSCFAGFLLELVFAADRGYMLDGQFEDDDRKPAELILSDNNFGPLTMPNNRSRLETRFFGHPEVLDAASALRGQRLAAGQALDAGLITAAPDDLDWEDEIRLLIEERASFSPDALSGMEASLRFPGPETLETKIFGRLSAWQNWIFQRPNAVGASGALQSYGTGKRAKLDRKRV